MLLHYVFIYFLLFLFAVSKVAHIHLQTNKRFAGLPEKRQRQVRMIVVAITGKVIVILLALPLMLSSWSPELSPSTKTVYVVHSTLYLFDMIHHDISPSLAVHHIASIGVAGFVLEFLLESTSADLYFLRAIHIFYVFATGLADLGADYAMFQYYTTFKSFRLARQISGASLYILGVRTLQWILLARQAIFDTDAAWKFFAFCPFMAVWMYEEYKEYAVVSALPRKIKDSMVTYANLAERRM
jgi:hypothetical protein